MNSMLDQRNAIAKKIEEIAKPSEDFPGITIIHNIPSNFNKIEFMSPRGRNILGLSEKDIVEMGADYYSRFFNEEDAKDYVPKMLEMVKKNDENAVYSFFQQVRRSATHPWVWYHSSTKILLRDDLNEPLLSITFAVPIDPAHHLTNKVSRLLEENNFLRANYNHYAKLTDREKQLMKLLATGESSTQVAEKLCIAVDTVKTHRKNIYQKLNINSVHELGQYARAFDGI